jgi:hypothetical protein
MKILVNINITNIYDLLIIIKFDALAFLHF